MRVDSTRAAPLLIFGLDAADPDLLLGWAGNGSLPAVAALLGRGASARLETPDTVSVHEIWTTAFSGVPLRTHGHYGRRVLEPGTYRLRALRPDDIPALPFWSRFQGTQRSALVFDVPDAKLLPGLAGFQILGWGEHPTPARAVSHPPGILEDARRRVGRPIRTDEREVGRAWDRWVLRRILARVERKRALCELLLSESSPDVAVVVFGDSHAGGHRFSRYLPPAGAVAEDGLGSALLEIYRAIDRAIGDLVRRFGEAANVVVVSNGGIREGYAVGALMQSFCTRLGYTVPLAATPLARREEGRASPWQRSMGRLAPSRFFRSLRKAPDLADVDWSKTSAFAIPSDHTGYLRVNLKGREPGGIVARGEEYESVLERLESDLRELVDESTGEPVIERTVRASALPGAGPPDNLPDLFVEWRSRRALPRRVLHSRAVLEPPPTGRDRDNHHSRQGLVIAAGPSISRQRWTGTLKPIELAPIFLELLGEPALACEVRGGA